jgi:REP element-mobilizing transposase RayT
MPFDPQRHHRRSIRLKGYDYSQAGAYFVTICAQNRECLFGEIVDGEMRLNGQGEIVIACWDNLPCHFPHIELDAFVVMPNHVHGIIVIAYDTGGGRGKAFANPSKCCVPTKRGSPGGSLCAVVQNFKSISTRKINQQRDARGAPVWQRNYYEHIIRDERELDRIREYIAANPAKWDEDTENPRWVRR